MTNQRRNPLIQIALIVLVSVLGIGSRRYAHTLPVFIAAYAGDTLWALAESGKNKPATINRMVTHNAARVGIVGER